MTTTKRIYAYVMALGGAAFALAAVGGAGLAHSINEEADTGCAVLSKAAGTGFALEAVYHSELAGQGEYRLSVKSVGGTGSTNINQGGGFYAASGETITLGRITVGGASAYDVKLTINFGGQAIECDERVSLSA